jgi:single-strand DNA-binding protein
MAGETYLTISGNLTATPKSGMSRHGTAWTRMRIASSSRVFDRQASEWRDGETLFVDISCWRKLAENAAKTLERGDRVIVLGRLRQRSYEDQQGVRHTVTEMEADAIGPDLGRAPAQLLRVAASAQPAEDEAENVPEAAGVAEAPAESAPAMAGAAEPAWP